MKNLIYTLFSFFLRFGFQSERRWTNEITPVFFCHVDSINSLTIHQIPNAPPEATIRWASRKHVCYFDRTKGKGFEWKQTEKKVALQGTLYQWLLHVIPFPHLVPNRPKSFFKFSFCHCHLVDALWVRPGALIGLRVAKLVTAWEELGWIWEGKQKRERDRETWCRSGRLDHRK